MLITRNNFINMHYTSFVLLYLNLDSTAIKIYFIITNHDTSGKTSKKMSSVYS